MSTATDRTYNPTALEREWQATWDREGTNSFTLDELRAAERPFFNLMMFPYPSAEGLHVGNIYAFTGADVHGRFRRMQGHDVFEPIGFDAFGIHSENFALKAGIHPMDLIPANVANFTRQLRRMGGMFDWDHTVDTTAPEYYRWTQWLFLQFFKHGLAEQKEAPVNWCPSDMTVLANEQVVVGACERCGTPVEQRFIRQWFLKITEYAGRLLDNLSEIDWSETTRKAQRAWIRRSRGAELRFPVAVDGHGADGDEVVVPVFTTRPDTVFGATYMVLAPEHPLVGTVTSDACRDEVERILCPHAGQGPGGAAEDREAQDGRVHRGILHQPGDAAADPRVDRRLRAHGVRDRCHHGRTGPRRARLRLRHDLRSPDRESRGR